VLLLSAAIAGGYEGYELDLLDHTRTSLESHLESLDVPPVHAKRLFRNLYQENSSTPWVGTTLPHALAPKLENDFEIIPLEATQKRISKYDGSVKFVFLLKDSLSIESVLMPESDRITICISSQVGCAQGCVFCHTGRMGLLRNLSVGEIVGQIRTANIWIKNNPDWSRSVNLDKSMLVTNVVFMGMGEPLDNVNNVINAVNIMTDPFGFNLPMSKVSVSTAGHLPGLEKIVKKIPSIRLALSVHNGDSEKRSKILPINKKWPIESVLDAISRHQEAGGNLVFIQYTLIQGINDSPEDALSLVNLLNGIKVKVNLIPLNPVDKMRLQSSNNENILEFQSVLHKKGIRTLIRYSKGQDIAAACGQLVNSKKN
jgi:23S rRNA (adenine2503-C2)-methyltransferase